MSTDNKQLALRFLQAIAAGDIPDQLVTDNMTAWTLTSGETNKASFMSGIRLFASIFSGTLNYVVDAIVEEGDRVVVETHSEGKLLNGDAFANIHVFLFHIHDGRVARVAEFMNPFTVKEKIVPLLQEIISKQ